jgi:hypothetical protein
MAYKRIRSLDSAQEPADKRRLSDRNLKTFVALVLALAVVICVLIVAS